jgi:aubergine
MLVSKSRERDIRAGQPEYIHYVPELCRATGMTDEMRHNFQLMKDLSISTRMVLKERVKQSSIKSNVGSTKVLQQWAMELDENLIQISGRELTTETICLGDKNDTQVNNKGEWVIRGDMHKPVVVDCWICIFPQ